MQAQAKKDVCNLQTFCDVNIKESYKFHGEPISLCTSGGWYDMRNEISDNDISVPTIV